MIVLEIPGKCQPKQRPRRGKGGHFYTPKETTVYEREVRWAARQAMRGKKPLSGPLRADIVIEAAIPPSWTQSLRTAALRGEKAPSRSDLDNQIKILLDGMQGICYPNDNIISFISAVKKYGLLERVTVKLQETRPGLIPQMPDHKQIVVPVTDYQ